MKLLMNVRSVSEKQCIFIVTLVWHADTKQLAKRETRKTRLNILQQSKACQPWNKICGRNGQQPLPTVGVNFNASLNWRPHKKGTLCILFTTVTNVAPMAIRTLASSSIMVLISIPTSVHQVVVVIRQSGCGWIIRRALKLPPTNAVWLRRLRPNRGSRDFALRRTLHAKFNEPML